MTLIEISGVTIAGNAAGIPNQITNGLRQHPEAIPVLKNLGLLSKEESVEGYILNI